MSSNSVWRVDDKMGKGGSDHAGKRRGWNVLCRLSLSGVFVYASYDKILHPQAFAEAVYSYQLLPDQAVNVVALVLPWLELVLGLCLLFGLWLPGTTLLCTGLLGIFLGALVYNHLRGLDVHCGCFSSQATEGPAGLGTVLRDIGFLVLAISLVVSVFGTKMSKR